MSLLSPEGRKIVELSSECLTNAKRASEKASRLRETSRQLRQQSAEIQLVKDVFIKKYFLKFK